MNPNIKLYNSSVRADSQAAAGTTTGYFDIIETGRRFSIRSIKTNILILGTTGLPVPLAQNVIFQYNLDVCNIDSPDLSITNKFTDGAGAYSWDDNSYRVRILQPGNYYFDNFPQYEKIRFWLRMKNLSAATASFYHLLLVEIEFIDVQ